jgi:ABC-type transport system involved in multi-copper enzyme maturation permease subunit
MMWLTWRQFRVQAVTVYAAVAACAVVLAITGPRLLDLTRDYPNAVFDQLTRTDRLLYNVGLVVMAVAPALIGAFWGAPMVARELEAGTHRLAWNQTVTRGRWLATKLGLTAFAAAAAVGMLTLAVSWWAAPLDGITGTARGWLPARLTPVAFAMRGIVPVGYAVFALVLGVAVGLVLRRTVPAMAVTLAVFTLVQIAVPLWVRPHLVPPVRQTVPIADSVIGIQLPRSGGEARLEVTTRDRNDWLLSSQTVDASGRATALPSWFGDCVPTPGPAGGPSGPATPVKESFRSCLTRLDEAGYRQQLVYQPASRFWSLQWAETALFGGLSGLLAWFCFWWSRRRVG